MSNDKINDGGPAFPNITPDMNVDGGPGMSLRDWFAGQALIGVMANPVALERGFTVDGEKLPIAESVFHIADALLKARGQ